MVRYFLCSNELPLQFTVEVMRNFPCFLHYFFCCYCWSSEKVHRWDGSSWQLIYEKLFKEKIVLEGEKVCEANLFLFLKFKARMVRLFRTYQSYTALRFLDVNGICFLFGFKGHL